MKATIKPILTILGLSLAISASAQKQAKYEEFLPVMLSLPPSGAIALLKTYQATQPEEGSIHLQMAKIYKNRYDQGDALTSFDYKFGNAELALASLELASQFATEKSVKKDKEHYFNFGRQNEKGKLDVPYDSVVAFIVNSRKELTGFIENGPNIYEKFTASFSHYDQAHKLFTEVVGEYATFKDLYLLFDEELDQKFEEIKQQYLKSVAAFEEYRLAIDAYPIGHDQTLLIEDISVYRLDGLESQINFLESEITVWNYGGWVDETRAIIADEIASLRESLVKEDQRLDQVLSTVQNEFQKDDFEELDVDKEVFFNLRKYDLNSVIEPIFLYKEEKHELEYNKLLSQALDTSSNVNINRRLFLYGQLINRLNHADSSLTKILNRNDEASAKKYDGFISAQYGSPGGINEFVQQEKTLTKNAAQKYFESIQNNLLTRIYEDTLSKEATYKRKKISLNPVPLPDTSTIKSRDFITTHRVINFDSSAYVAGVFWNQEEEKISSFIAGITPTNQVAWFSEYIVQVDSGSNDADTRIGAISAAPGGVAVVLNGSQKGSGKKANKLFFINEKGETTGEKRLNLFAFPRTLNYNELDNTIFITMKGKEYYTDLRQEEELIMANYSILGDLQWQHRFKFKGDVTDAITTQKGFIIVGNYAEMRMLDGEVNRSGAPGGTKVFAMRIEKPGIKSIKTMETNGVASLLTAIKVSNDCINLFGNNGFYGDETRLTSDEWFHILINRNLETLSTSL